ncbi:hypothetical protein MGH68_05515 [Erysipelothrix sp. D19-032]
MLLKEIEAKSAVRHYDGANWNENEDNFTQTFYEQNLSQFRRPKTSVLTRFELVGNLASRCS